MSFPRPEFYLSSFVEHRKVNLNNPLSRGIIAAWSASDNFGFRGSGFRQISLPISGYSGASFAKNTERGIVGQFGVGSTPTANFAGIAATDPGGRVVQGLDNLTVFAIVKPTIIGGGTTANINTIISQEGTEPDTVFILRADNGTPRIQTANGSAYQAAVSSQTFNANTWYSVAGRLRKSDNSLSIFVNGALKGTAAGPNRTTITSNQPLRIGNNNGLDRSWFGFIQVVFLFNTAKTDAELVALTLDPYQIYRSSLPLTLQFDAPTGATNSLSGTSTGTSTASGTLLVEKTLTGASSGTSTATGSLEVGKSLAGQSDGTGGASGGLSVEKPLSGSSAGIGSASGTLATGTNQQLAGTSSGVGGASGTLSTAPIVVGNLLPTAIENLDLFLDPALTVGAIIFNQVVRGYFDEEFNQFDFNESEVEGRNFAFYTKTSALIGVQRGTPITVYSRNFKVAQIKPDDDGLMTELILEEL